MAYNQACAPLILQMLIASARATRQLTRVIRLWGTFPMALYPPGLYKADSKCRQLYATWAKTKGIPPVRSGSKQCTNAGTLCYTWRENYRQHTGGETMLYRGRDKPRTISTMSFLKSHFPECSDSQGSCSSCDSRR